LFETVLSRSLFSVEIGLFFACILLFCFTVFFSLAVFEPALFFSLAVFEPAVFFSLAVFEPALFFSLAVFEPALFFSLAVFEPALFFSLAVFEPALFFSLAVFEPALFFSLAVFEPCVFSLVFFVLYFIGFFHWFFPRLNENGPMTSSSEFSRGLSRRVRCCAFCPGRARASGYSRGFRKTQLDFRQPGPSWIGRGPGPAAGGAHYRFPGV